MPVTEFQLGLAVGARTERGRREENQDQMTAFRWNGGYVYLVADGMGGHRGGMDASRIVAEGYRQQLAGMAGEMPLEEALQRATAGVNAELLRNSEGADPGAKNMGSTVALAAFLGAEGRHVFVTGHIGDSRVYLWRGGTLRRLTDDHSVVQRMLDERLLTPEEAWNHPNSNILTKALGQHATVELEISGVESVRDGDMLLLCSDGLWGSIPDEVLAERLGSGASPAVLAEELVKLALERGSDDNVTVQLIRATEPPRDGAAGAAAAGTAGAGTAARAPGRSVPFLVAGVLVAVLLGVGAYLAMLRGWPLHAGRKQQGAPIVSQPPEFSKTGHTHPKPSPATPAGGNDSRRGVQPVRVNPPAGGGEPLPHRSHP